MKPSETDLPSDRLCLRDAIHEIADAARYLDAAVSAHLAGDRDLARELIRLSDMPVIREWSESIWGPASPHILYRVVAGAPPSLSRTERIKARMPSSAEKELLLKRDGFHCRFCGIPVIRAEVRQAIRSAYPEALPWGPKNTEQHAAFQAMWLQYDHVLPHARGGNNDLENVIISCAPCNYGRWNKTIEEVGVLDPQTREPIRSPWDGLERFLNNRDQRLSSGGDSGAFPFAHDRT